MENWLRITLVLSVATLVLCKSLPKTSGSSQDAVLIGNAIMVYNRVPGGTYLFKLLETDPGNRPEDSASPRKLQFTIKETVCLKWLKKENIEECAFKDNGLVKHCTATHYAEESYSPIVFNCYGMPHKQTHVRRSRQARQCVFENNIRKCRVNKPNRPGALSAVARPAKDKVY